MVNVFGKTINISKNNKQNQSPLFTRNTKQKLFKTKALMNPNISITYFFYIESNYLQCNFNACRGHAAEDFFLYSNTHTIATFYHIYLACVALSFLEGELLIMDVLPWTFKA